jgi:beta-galactosidase
MRYGTAYYPDYFPESDWARDLDAMCAAGITSVRILEFAWCWYQPRPDTFRFGPLDRFLELCLARGLRVCLCTPTATPPPWFFQKHPDCRLIDVSGRPSYSHRHMVCWQHPGALAEALRTIETLAARYAKHPAVWGWQIDNEPNYAEKVADCYDFNPHALAAGQAWLRERYRDDLSALNAAWYNQFWSQAYDDWSQIWVTHRPQTNPGSFVDFLRWREHALAVFVRTQRDLLRRLCPAHRIGVNIPEVGVHFSTVIGQDYWAQAAGLDWVGTDLYAATADRAADLRALRYSTDLMRSAVAAASPAAEFLIAETQGGPHLRTWECGFAGYPWDASYLRDSVHAYAERGARQVWFFLWRPVPGGQEIGMNATTDLDGGPTEFTREIARLAREDSAALAASAAAYAERPLALVHYSQDTHRFLAFHGQLPVAGRSQLGCHAWLDTQGYRVAYLTDADLENPIPDAALLVLPESHLLSDAAQKNLLAWAESSPSRRLVLGPHTGLLDERAQLRGPSRLPLWTALGLRPGPWRDMGVPTPHRVFLPQSASAPTEPLRPRPNVFVYPHRWTDEHTTGSSASALPAA